MVTRIILPACVLTYIAKAQSGINDPKGHFCAAVGSDCDCIGFMIVKGGNEFSNWRMVNGRVPCTGVPGGFCLCQKKIPLLSSSQSSTEAEHISSFGTDFNLATYSLTSGFRGELNPWWQVDFGRNELVGTIRLRNRDDECASRLLGGFECDWSRIPAHQAFTDQGGAVFGLSQSSPCRGHLCFGTECDSISYTTWLQAQNEENQVPWFELTGCQGQFGRYVYIQLLGRFRVLSIVEMQVLDGRGANTIPARLPVSDSAVGASGGDGDDSDFAGEIMEEVGNQWWFWIIVCCLCCCMRQCFGRSQQEGGFGKPSAYQRIVTAMGLRGRTAIPIYWENRDKDLSQALDRNNAQFFDEKYPVSPEVHNSLEELMNQTSEYRQDLPGLTIIRAVRIEDAVMWASYQTCAAEIKENRGDCMFQGEGPPSTMAEIAKLGNNSEFSHRLEPELCECYLWHATNPENAMKIAEDGFRVDLSSTKRFGKGAYFAEDPGKSDSYAKPGTGLYKDTYAMLLCRCVLGEQYVTTRQSESVAQQGVYDSTLAEPPNETREFICYRDEQVYPEYAIVYERRNPAEKDETTYWDDEDGEAIKGSLPTYWTNNAETVAKRPTAQFDEMYPATAMKKLIQEMADKTWRNVWTRDRKGSDGQRIPIGDPNKDMPEGMRILKVLRVEDLKMWKMYMAYQDEIRARRGEECASLDYEDVRTTEAMGRHRRRLAGDVNEVYLWHGSSPMAVMSIAEDGFKVDTTRGGLFFGPGAYFAECSSKADEYSKDEEDGYYKGYYAMLLCRVTLGEVQVLHQADQYANQRVGPGQYFDSTLGDRESAVGTYREFVVPTELAAYPEYAIIYERIYVDTRVRGLQVRERPEPAPARPVYGMDLAEE